MVKERESRRNATVRRETRETRISVELELDGTGEYRIQTGIPFFDHMLESLARHALFDLTVEAKGDIAVDYHHTVEDVGISLGQAFRQALGQAAGICRYASFSLPMAESRVDVSLDVSNRPFLRYQVELENTRVGDFDASLAEDFFQAFSQNAGLDLHIEKRYGHSPHHVVEAVFKGVARSLREAVAIDPRETGPPSVKGAL